MRNFKPTAVRRNAPNAVTLENSPYRDHFDFVADCVLCKHESRDHFFKTVAAMVAEYQPATFVESSQVAMMAVDRWRQFRYCGMFAAVTASDSPDRARLLKLFASRERHCQRSYDLNRKALLKMLSARVNSVGGPTPRPPGSQKRNASARDNLLTFPKAVAPIAA